MSEPKNSPFELFQQVLELESSSIIACKNRITTKSVDQLCALYGRLISLGGNLVFSGVGKSGIIAKKMAATFSSLGLPSFFLHPVEALHGDLGRLSHKDAIVWISKSGSTEEILKLIPFLQVPKENTVALVGAVHSEIALKSEVVFDCSVEKEACLNNLAPTTSTTVALAIGDAMAVLYESYVGLSKESFARNHPAGLLGKTLLLKVSSLMVPLNQCPVAKVETMMSEVLLSMTSFPTGLCGVIDDLGNLIGVIVEGDIRRFISKGINLLSLKAKDVMNAQPKKISSEDLAFDALTMMEEKGRMVSSLPVVDRDQLVGIIRMHDLLKEGFQQKN
ncbi:MAG: KpsF/GutQ family sugar-phosphate isomerase [Bacteriovoracaceae bacterium]|nr:KpsF/GutQ family sugar-phosphate isomerase [Bacteriovoracaceae bacterium]